jgi:hypothetical protein
MILAMERVTPFFEEENKIDNLLHFPIPYMSWGLDGT